MTQPQTPRRSQHGFHTPEKLPLNGAMNGIKMILDQSAGPNDRHATIDVIVLSQKESHLQSNPFNGGLHKVQTTSASTSASLQQRAFRRRRIGLRKSVNPSHQISACHISGASSPMLLAVWLTTRHRLRLRTRTLSLDIITVFVWHLDVRR